MSRNLNSQVKHFEKYIYGLINPINMLYPFEDKSYSSRQFISYMLVRTQSMFKWQGLPDTIPERSLELYLQTNGNTCFYKHEDSLYVFTGGLGGEPDVYYMPTLYIIANPALNLSKTLKIDTDCVVMPNDSLYLGLLPLFTRYSTLMTENEISMKLAIINTRIIDLISAPDDRTKESAEKFLQDIRDGKQGIIAENAFLEGIKAQPSGMSSSNTVINALLEMEQYLKASWFNELGLDANFNMKREHLISSENEMNTDALLPLVDDMLKCRRIAAEKVNKMFGLNISVELSSSWKETQKELKSETSTDEQDTEPDTETKGGEEDGITAET